MGAGEGGGREGEVEESSRPGRGAGAPNPAETLPPHPAEALTRARGSALRTEEGEKSASCPWGCHNR